jgi:hypothetical protein
VKEGVAIFIFALQHFRRERVVPTVVEHDMQNPFVDLMAFTGEAIRLALNAQEVIRMRVLQFACGDGTLSEATAMISEKTDAFMDAQLAAGLSVMTGRPGSAAIGALRCYSDRVEANLIRLNA